MTKAKFSLIFISLIISISILCGGCSMRYYAPQPLTKPYSEIFTWVKSVMPPVFEEGFDEVPEVYIVGRDELKERMADSIDTDPLYGKWIEQFGHEDAEKMRANTIKQVVTLCHTRTLRIYVVEGLDPCQTETQISYGMAYYLMLSKYGNGGELDLHQGIVRRMYYGKVATIVKMTYFQTFCMDEGNSCTPSPEKPAGESEKDIEV